MSTLDAKLKQDRIPFTKEGSRYILQSAKIDFLRYLWAVVLPGLAGIGILAYNILQLSIEGGRSRLWIASIGFIATCLYNYNHHRKTRKANSNTIILENNLIRIKDQQSSQSFDSRNTHSIQGLVESMDDGITIGQVQLLDHSGKAHTLLGFKDRGEEFVKSNLQWYMNYFESHLQLETHSK